MEEILIRIPTLPFHVTNLHVAIAIYLVFSYLFVALDTRRVFKKRPEENKENISTFLAWVFLSPILTPFILLWHVFVFLTGAK